LLRKKGALWRDTRPAADAARPQTDGRKEVLAESCQSFLELVLFEPFEWAARGGQPKDKGPQQLTLGLQMGPNGALLAAD